MSLACTRLLAKLAASCVRRILQLTCDYLYPHWLATCARGAPGPGGAASMAIRPLANVATHATGEAGLVHIRSRGCWCYRMRMTIAMHAQMLVESEDCGLGFTRRGSRYRAARSIYRWASAHAGVAPVSLPADSVAACHSERTTRARSPPRPWMGYLYAARASCGQVGARLSARSTQRDRGSSP